MQDGFDSLGNWNSSDQTPCRWMGVNCSSNYDPVVKGFGITGLRFHLPSPLPDPPLLPPPLPLLLLHSYSSISPKVPSVLHHHAVALGSFPKFRVLSSDEIRISVWNHTVDSFVVGAQCIYEIAHFDNWDCQFPPPLMLFTSFTANKIKPGPFQVSATATTRTSAIFPLFLKTFILKWMVHGLQLAPPWPRRQRGDVVGDIEAPQGIDRGGHESTDLDFISTTKIMSILMVSTIVQVVGIILSLHAATKISSRAQGIATFACRWHALMTCSSNDSPHKRSSDSLVNFEAANRLSSLHTSYSDSDLESTDYVHVPTNSQLASHRASYHK
ncbi:uncharacterized protein LOC103955333 isoform X3 [Pyrus x bretschneideri]|uniref:uncharacterized protein LOC103955333 isoform X3 n=1 Tax=Pyrus x bretschneideri TaxID=225117 RepID=UPI0020302791|nr:uncharacterized protein LOC103955333 isoform X3 [Pyrus x bretschneideri]